MAIRGFEVFHSKILDSLVFDQQGKALCSVQYTGLALLETKDDYNFPVILGHGDLSLEINAEGHVIVGMNNRENLFFYKNLKKMVSLLSGKSALQESIPQLGNDEILGQVIRQQIDRQDSLLAGFRQMLNDSSKYFASLLLKGKLLLDSSSMERDTASIKRWKEILLRYIYSNMELLRHSDLIQQVSLRYMAMNDWIHYTPEQYNQQFIEDINDWIAGLNKLVTREEVINQFLTLALNSYYVTPAAAILESFPNDVLCPVPMQMKEVIQPLSDVPFVLWGYPGNRYQMSSLNGAKVLLIFVDPDCKASIPAQVMVTRYLKENKIGLPYVTVFNTSSPEKLSKWMPAIGLYCDTNLDPAMILVSYSAIEHYPAFVILDGDSKVAERFYTLPEIKAFLRTLKLKGG